MSEPAGRPAEVKAAGGVVVRAEGGEPRVALVHRPRYDDWSLPKGKLDQGETFEDAALREVEEETGLRCELGPELRPLRYTDQRGRSKLVRWWRMTPVADGGFAPGTEIDERRWCSAEEARTLLSYTSDVALLDEALTASG